MARSKSPRRPPRTGKKRLPNNRTSFAGLSAQVGILSTNHQGHDLPNMTNPASLGPVVASPNAQLRPFETISPTFPSTWPAPLSQSHQRDTSPLGPGHVPATMRLATTESYRQIKMSEQTPEHSRVVTDPRSNTARAYRTHIATLRNGVPQKGPSKIFNGSNSSRTYAPALSTSRAPAHTACPLVEDENGDFIPLRNDHYQHTEFTPTSEREDHRGRRSGRSRSGLDDNRNSTGTMRLQRRFNDTDSAPTSANQDRTSPTTNLPSSENLRSNTANIITVRSYTELEYPLVPAELQGARIAMGEASWGVYLELMERYVVGEIDENELEKEVGKQFLLSDDAAGRKLRSLTEKMVKDKLDVDSLYIYGDEQ